jgi:hypothetical protein
MKFLDSTKDKVLRRQNYRCAVCKSKLTNTAYIDFHHVIPKQTALIFNMDPGFIKSSDNCVAIHNSFYEESDCHYDAHGGNYRTGAVGLPSFFKYAFSNPALLPAWGKTINEKFEKHRKKH